MATGNLITGFLSMSNYLYQYDSALGPKTALEAKYLDKETVDCILNFDYMRGQVTERDFFSGAVVHETS